MSDIAETLSGKSDRVTADSLIGSYKDIVIKKVDVDKNRPDGEKCHIYFEGDEGVPFKPCLTMRRLLKAVWKETPSAEWGGRSIRLYNDPNVMHHGKKVGGVRISHVSHIDKEETHMLVESQSKKRPWTVKPLQVNQTVTPAELSVDERVNRFAKEFGARLGKGAYAEFDAWWNDNTEIRGVIPETRLTNMENAIATAIEKGWQ